MSKYTITDKDGNVIYEGNGDESEALVNLIDVAIASHYANTDKEMKLSDVLKESEED